MFLSGVCSFDDPTSPMSSLVSSTLEITAFLSEVTFVSSMPIILFFADIESSSEHCFSCSSMIVELIIFLQYWHSNTIQPYSWISILLYGTLAPHFSHSMINSSELIWAAYRMKLFSLTGVRSGFGGQSFYTFSVYSFIEPALLSSDYLPKKLPRALLNISTIPLFGSDEFTSLDSGLLMVSSWCSLGDTSSLSTAYFWGGCSKCVPRYADPPFFYRWPATTVNRFVKFSRYRTCGMVILLGYSAGF